MKKLKLEELGRVDLTTYKQAEKMPICILLDNVRSLHNVGSAFRTADAFSVEKIILTGITGQPPHREIQKTALGATESVQWEYDEDVLNAVKLLKEAGYTLALVEQTTHSISLEDFHPKAGEKYCFIFGNEVHGVSDLIVPYADCAIEISQSGTKHSLNISVCVGIVIHDVYQKIKQLR